MDAGQLSQFILRDSDLLSAVFDFFLLWSFLSSSMYRDGYIIPCLKKVFLLAFQNTGNSEVATYNGNIKSSDNATRRKGG